MEAKEFSLAILGDKGVGKTSFCNRYINKTFNPSESPTNGGEYFQKIFYDNNAAIKIDIFDTSGDPRSKKIVKYLYKDARSIILMFNLKDKSTFDNLPNYLEEIRNNSVEDPIIYLVGNFSKEAGINGVQVLEKDIKKFILENNIKYFDISCKSGEGINEVMKELTKEILDDEKYFNSTIDRDISDTSIRDNSEKDIEKLGKALKSFYKETKDKKNKFIRCKICHKLLFIKFRNNGYSLICPSCKTEDNIKIDGVLEAETNSSNNVICYECLKNKEDKIKLEFCGKCKRFHCPKCKNNIIKQLKAEGSEIHNLVPYYLMDIICYDHMHKVIGYCKNCKKNFCNQCYNQHGAHENNFFDDDLVRRIKDEHIKELEKEKDNFKKFKELFEICIYSIRTEVLRFIDLKNKEIKFKEQLLNQLINIPNNYQLIETVKNMKYMKLKKYDINSSWDKKLTDIFEVIGQPIQIKTININKNNKGDIHRKIIQIKNVKKEDEIKIHENVDFSVIDKNEEVTDFCSMNDDKYLGISFANGSLELYDNIEVKQEPIHTFQILDKDEGIKSIYKSIRNTNNFFFCGKGKIKNIEFYDEYKNMRTLMEIIDNRKIFKYVLEQNNYIISCDYENKLIIYDKKSNQIGDITESIDPNGKKYISSLTEIIKNIFYITFSKNIDVSNSPSKKGNTYFFDNENEEQNIDISALRTSINDNIEKGTKIIELNENTFKTKREHILSEKQQIIGAISDNIILIRDDEYNSVNLFDAKKFKNFQRVYFDEGEKPIFCSVLNRRNSLIDFILLSEKMILFQNIYDEENRNLKQISELKVKNENSEEGNYTDIYKEGKMIHLPFKGLVKYMDDNKFVIINYN